MLVDRQRAFNVCGCGYIHERKRAEIGRVDLLRDVFTWAYERSCERFKAIAATLPEPDPFRLKFRSELIEAVGEIVRTSKATTFGAVKQMAANLVPAEDLPKFAKLVSDELRNLHEGNIARYRLRLEEFKAWQKSLPKIGNI